MRERDADLGSERRLLQRDLDLGLQVSTAVRFRSTSLKGEASTEESSEEIIHIEAEFRKGVLDVLASVEVFRRVVVLDSFKTYGIVLTPLLGVREYRVCL